MDKVMNCAGHEDPDLWYPEWPPHRPSISKVMAIVDRVKEAMSLCESCPAKSDCLAVGMEEINLTQGIWGGKMAGERLALAGVQLADVVADSDEGRAFEFSIRMTPWVRW